MQLTVYAGQNSDNGEEREVTTRNVTQRGGRGGGKPQKKKKERKKLGPLYDMTDRGAQVTLLGGWVGGVCGGAS